MLTEQSYMNAWLVYGLATAAALFVLNRWMRGSIGPTARIFVLSMLGGLALTPAHPDETVATWAPALIVAAFDFLTEGAEAASRMVQPLLAGQAVAFSLAILLCLAGRVFGTGRAGWARRATRSRLLVPICVAFFLGGSGSVDAQDPLPDVRVLIDVSGSMRDSDPRNLREPALELIVQLLPEGSRAGVWTFGRRVNMVVPHGKVDDAWRERATMAVSSISNHGLLTNIPDAIELSTFDIERLAHRYRTSIILLTDGKVEVSERSPDNARAARDLLQKIAPELRDWGVGVHTIALSDEADWEFLRALARTTGGLAERVRSAEELSAVFLQAFDIAAPTEQVPLLGGEFLIDDSVEEFTALVFPDPDTGPVGLIGPDGVTLTRENRGADAQWYHNERFELITVREPAPGEWRIVAPGSISRVNVISHLSLLLDRPPSTMPSGRTPEFGLRLVDGDEVLVDPDLLALVEVRAKVSRENGGQWEITASGAELGAGGEFRIDLPMLAEPGRYEVVINLDGRSFQREVSFVTDVIDPPPAIDPAEAMPAEPPPGGLPGWLPPAAISLLLSIGLGLWFMHRRRMEDHDVDGSGDDRLDGDGGDGYR